MIDRNGNEIYEDEFIKFFNRPNIVDQYNWAVFDVIEV